MTWGKRKDGQPYKKTASKGISGNNMNTSPTSDVHLKEQSPSSMRRIHICKHCTKLLEGAEEINKHFKDNPSHLETENKVEKDKEDNEFSILSGNNIHLKEHLDNEEFGRGYWSGLNEEQKLDVVKDALKYVPEEERHDMEHIESKISSTKWDDLYEDEKEAVLKVIS